MADDHDDGDMIADVLVEDAGSEDEEQAETKAISESNAGILSKLEHWGCIFIRNETGGPLLVYTRRAARRRLKQGELRLELTQNGIAFAVNKVMEQLSSNETHTTVIDPPSPDAKRMSAPVRVKGDTLISIRRYSSEEDDAAPSLKWDCLDKFVPVGKKLTVKGTAVPLNALIAP